VKIKSRKKVDEDINAERLIIRGLLISLDFTRRISPICKSSIFSNQYHSIIVGWALDYFHKYDDVIGYTHLRDIYFHEEETLDEEVAEGVEEILKHLSKEHEGEAFNPDYAVDMAEEYLNKKQITDLLTDTKKSVIDSDIPGAVQALENYTPVSVLQDPGIDPFDDEDAIRSAFTARAEPLFTMPGAVGKMLNDQLVRGSFFGIMASEKKGKSWWLMEFAVRARRCNKKVAFFSVGDMSKDQQTMRFMIRVGGKSDQERYCGDTLVPVLDCHYNQITECPIKKCPPNNPTVLEKDDDGERIQYTRIPYEEADDYMPCTYCRRKHPETYKGEVWYEPKKAVSPLTYDEGVAKAKLFNRLHPGKLRMVTTPTDVMNVQMIKAQLELWKDQNGFIPDVIVVDYADIMAPEPGQREFRHQQNTTWKALRSLSIELNICLITATQTDARAYTAGLLNLSNFSEDKRKYAHVTSMIGLNQTPEEKVRGIMRINQLLAREDEFNSMQTVKCLQSLQTGRALLASYR